MTARVPDVADGSRVTVRPGDDPVHTWQRIAALARAHGAAPLPAVRLALAAVELAGTPRLTAVVELAATGDDGGQPAVQATVRGGAGAPLPPGLVDSTLTRTTARGDTEHTVSVRLDAPPPDADAGYRTLQDAAGGGDDMAHLLHLLACSLAVVGRHAAESEAASALRAELDETDRGLLAVHAEMAALQDELEHARAGAEQASRAKGAFLANVCHEIRSPVTAITGFTGLLLGTTLTPEQADYAETIRVTGGHLLGLIGDVLDVSKIEAGRLEFEHVPFSLVACVEDAVAILASQADQKGIVLAALFRPGTPEQIAGDPLRVRQILVNLLANSVKFTSEGEVTVTVDHQPSTPTSAQLTFRVTDTGIGMPPDVLARLFTPFTQASVATSRTYGGTGLGLSICRQLCEHMGGTITAESTVGVGSTFTASVTVDLPEPDRPPARPALAGTHALVVSPHPTIAAVLCGHLVACGATAASADSLADAAGCHLAVLHVEEPARLAALAAGNHAGLPVVAVTPLRQRRALTQARIPHPIVSLPARRDPLLAAALQALGRRPAVRAASGPDQPSATPAAEQPTAGTVLYIDDDPLMIELIRRIFTRIPHIDLLTASDGHTAYELATTNDPNLILLDLNLPDTTGHELLRRLRAHPHTSALPIVIISGAATPETIQQTAQLGATSYLAKPFKATELQQLIQDAIPAPV